MHVSNFSEHLVQDFNVTLIKFHDCRALADAKHTDWKNYKHQPMIGGIGICK